MKSEIKGRVVCLVGCLFGMGAVLVFSQGVSGSNHLYNYDLQRPLPLTLQDAYALAVEQLGSATNQFYCVSASCTNGTNRFSSGWTFTFANTNGVRASLKVSFTKVILLSPADAALLK